MQDHFKYIMYQKFYYKIIKIKHEAKKKKKRAKII